MIIYLPILIFKRPIQCSRHGLLGRERRCQLSFVVVMYCGKLDYERVSCKKNYVRCTSFKLLFVKREEKIASNIVNYYFIFNTDDF